MARPDRFRVAVTGVGMVSPLGVGRSVTWEHVLAGKSGIGPITRFDPEGLKTKIAGEVPAFDAADWLPSKEAARTQLYISYAVAAARMAIEDAGLPDGLLKHPETGILAGCGIGGMEMMESAHRALLDRGAKRVSPFFIPQFIGNMAAGVVAMHLGVTGPNLTYATACAAGCHAIGEGFRKIRDGYAPCMIAGGTESVLVPSTVAGFNAMKALSTRNESPETASRPFDATRDGFVIGEGACFLILERLDAAEARGADILAEVVGYGASCDAYHLTAPAPEGRGMAAAMDAALKDADVAPEAVGYINAHGTSTPMNDVLETAAIRKVFGLHADRLAVSSTKSMTGHLLGAAGALEGGLVAMALSSGMLPPTANHQTPDPECNLDVIANVARKKQVAYALNNSFGFGGTNASLLMAACS